MMVCHGGGVISGVSGERSLKVNDVGLFVV
jgi:hypothetical protein